MMRETGVITTMVVMMKMTRRIMMLIMRAVEMMTMKVMVSIMRMAEMMTMRVIVIVMRTVEIVTKRIMVVIVRMEDRFVEIVLVIWTLNKLTLLVQGLIHAQSPSCETQRMKSIVRRDYNLLQYCPQRCHL